MTRGTLWRDERGAIMVLALFCAVFAAALLFVLVGTAQSIFTREGLQDAVDSAALSGAILHARAMNLLVLINIVMAAFLAILVTIKLVEALALAGIAIAAGLAFLTSGASLAAVPPLKVVASEMKSTHQQLEPPIMKALEVLHATSDTLVDLAPGAAEGVAEASARRVGSVAIQIAARDELPVEDDSFSRLCGEAGRLPFDLAGEVFSVSPMNVVWGKLGGVAGSLATRFSDWFCGEGEDRPPASEATAEVTYPRLREFLACEADDDVTFDGDLSAATSPQCVESERVQEAATPDEEGHCRKGDTDCSLGSPYDRRVTQAREECHPKRLMHVKRVLEYEYQIRQGRVAYRWTKIGWVRGEEDSVSFELGKSLLSPCKTSEFNPVVRESDDVNEVLPACTDETPPQEPPAEEDPKIQYVRFKEVRHILGCRVEEVVPVEVRGASKVEGGDDRASKRVVGDAALGGEAFQIRAIASADPGRGAPGAVRLALWGHEEEKHPFPELQPYEGLALAQAEYFYDGADGRDAWMWNMRWRARLKRFRLPEGDSRGLERGCGRHGDKQSSCLATLNAIAKMGGALAH